MPEASFAFFIVSLGPCAFLLRAGFRDHHQ